MCGSEVTVTSLRPPRLCRLAVFSIRPYPPGKGYKLHNHMPGVSGVDSDSWGLGGGFPFLVVDSRSLSCLRLPGKAISPWEGSQATPKPKTCLGRPYPPGKGHKPHQHPKPAWEGHIPLGRVTSHKTTCLGFGGWIPIAGVWGVDSHSWCQGGRFPRSLFLR